MLCDVTIDTSRVSTARGELFKADHARAIDRYIDYFGGQAAADVTAEDDPCGERFLDALFGREESRVRPC